MSGSWATLVARGGLDSILGGDDPRVGSGRDGSEGGTLSTTSANKSSSLSSLGATFIPVVVYASLCLIFFFVLRPRVSRVYGPRALSGLRSPHIPSPTLPSGLLNWIKPYYKIPDTFALNHGSLDGFFFLRYLKVLRNVFLVGMCISWPVLFPVHATGGNGLNQLDLLTIGNVEDPNRLFAHVVVAWIFFGFVLFTITRECLYYIGIRQAYLSSPHQAKRISSRTVLITSVPKQYLDERRLRKLYGDSVKRVWIPRTSKALVKAVEEREQTAMRLEKAEIKLIRKANIARTKQLKKNPPPEPPPTVPSSPNLSRTSGTESEQLQSSTTQEVQVIDDARSNASNPQAQEGFRPELTKTARLTGTSHDLLEKSAEDPDYVHPYGLGVSIPDVRGSVAAQWIPAEARPYHRPLHNFFRRVDTVRWCRMRLKELNTDIYKLRKQVKRGECDALPAAFIEFDTQEAAQAAHQVVAHHRPLQLAPRILGVRPDEIVWTALRMRWWERIIRRFFILGLVTAAVIFWSIPTAVIGFLSNIEFLSNIFFLQWLRLLPKVIIGFLQRFVPAIVLTFWMSLVPAMLRFCGIQAGIPSLVMVELFTQSAYFAFQVVQVFLITTLTSAASAAFIDIIKDPISAKDLLAQNLPKASNFYLSYILVQCLAVGATGILHLFDLVRHTTFGKMAPSPRSRFNIWYKLRPPRWGGVYPIFTNMAVIAFSYTCIAPLILAFAAIGLSFVRMIYRYNVLYVFDSELDSKGLFYPRALIHLIVGVYMAEICMIGLFALKLAFIPMALMLIFFIFTGLVHFSLSEAIFPLLQNLPQTLSLEEELQEEERTAEEARRQAEAEAGNATGGAANNYYDEEQNFGEQGSDEEEPPTDNEDGPTDHGPQGSRAMEGASGVRSHVTNWLKMSTRQKLDREVEKSGLNKILEKLSPSGNSNPDQPPGFLKRFFYPQIYEDFIALRKLIVLDDQPGVEDVEDHTLSNYWPPELWKPKPVLWIPRDEACVSRQEVAHTRSITPITDLGARLDKKGLIVADVEAAPFPRMRLLH